MAYTVVEAYIRMHIIICTLHTYNLLVIYMYVYTQPRWEPDWWWRNDESFICSKKLHRTPDTEVSHYNYYGRICHNVYTNTTSLYTIYNGVMQYQTCILRYVAHGCNKRCVQMAYSQNWDGVLYKCTLKFYWGRIVMRSSTYVRTLRLAYIIHVYTCTYVLYSSLTYSVILTYIHTYIELCTIIVMGNSRDPISCMKFAYYMMYYATYTYVIISVHICSWEFSVLSWSQHMTFKFHVLSKFLIYQ